MESITTQGISLPRLGLGTYRLEGSGCTEAVENALQLGYRHIDTAEMYGNEAAIGAAIASSGIKRDMLHVTTKVWYENLSQDALRMAFDASLKKLKLDYIDLYLVHWPTPDLDYEEVFESLVNMKEQGLIKALGVANFTVPMLLKLVETMKLPIACNQVEYHVLLSQSQLLAFLQPRNIPLVAYCPLAQGQATKQSEILQIAKKHNVQPGQVALKWLLDQDGVCAIPKAQHSESQKANLESFNVKLDDEDRKLIAGLPKNKRLVNPSFAPDWDTKTAA